MAALDMLLYGKGVEGIVVEESCGTMEPEDKILDTISEFPTSPRKNFSFENDQ